jgi:hypothetical protein
MIFMTKTKRLRHNKRQSMTKRMKGCKGPMSAEDKEAKKKLAEKHRQMTKAALEKQRAAKK